MKRCKRFLSLALALMMALALLPTPASAASRGELIVPCQYGPMGRFYNGFAKVSKDGKNGYVDTTGQEFLMGKYDFVLSFSGAGIAPVGIFVRSTGLGAIYKWGLINVTGELVVPYEYESSSVTSFPSGLVIWERDGKYGLLGAGGQEAAPFIYDSIYSFRVDYALVKRDGKEGLFDVNGREVVPCVYDSIVPSGSYASDGYAKDGMIQVKQDGKYGFVNTRGELVVPCRYDRVTNFSGGYAAVGTAIGEIPKYGVPECLWGIVNTAGQEVVPCQYETDIYGVSEGFMSVKQNGKYGVINTANELVVPCKYDSVQPFKNGYAMIWQNGKCGYIDAAGKEIVPCDQYSFTMGFHDGLALMWKGDYRGYVDTTGAVAIPFQYYSASDFSEGFAAVRTEKGKYGYIDTTGKAITPFQYDNAMAFKNGVALVERNGKLGYINTAGKEIIPCKYDTMAGLTPYRYDDLAQMKLNGKYGLVSTVTGQEVVPCIYDDMYAPYDGYMQVKQNGSYGAIYIGSGDAPASTTPTAYSNPQSILIDGAPVQFTTYAIDDETGGTTNYVKLRDLAYVLNGTAAQFSVGWNGEIYLTAGQPYEANGSEMKTPFSGDRAYAINSAKVFVNGKEAQLDAIVLTDDQGNDYTYFKLRDLGQALGFNVSWDSMRGVYLETDKPYIG